MKRIAAYLTAPKTFEFIEEEISPLKPNEILVKTISVGLCHSDVPVYLGTNSYGLGENGKYVMWDSVTYPQLKGHEPVGEVVEVGSQVKKFKVGDYITGHKQQTFTDYFIIEENDRFAVIPKTEKPIECCLGEPAVCCSYIAQRAQPVFGDNIAVVGAGFMGLLSMIAVKAAFLNSITVIDFDKERLELAKHYGAEYTINPAETDLMEAADAITGGKGFDVTVELTGSLNGLKTAAKICKTLSFGNKNTTPGKIVSSSVYAKPEKWDPDLGHQLMFHAPTIEVAHPWGITDYNGLLEKSVNAYVKGAFPIDEMVTHRVSFENIGKGFELLTEKIPGFVKGIVEFK